MEHFAVIVVEKGSISLYITDYMNRVYIGYLLNLVLHTNVKILDNNYHCFGK